VIIEEQRFFIKLSEILSKAIDKYYEKTGVDKSFHSFKITCDVLDSGFKKIDEYVLIDENVTFCHFCNNETHYYDDKSMLWICSECYGKVVHGK
jgi:hypothetical protein